MHIVITGGAGFIGSHLADSQLANGSRVTVLDNLSRGNLKNVPQTATFEQVDVAEADLRPIFQRLRPDVVVHCAAHPSVSGSMSRPLDDCRANQWAAWQVAEGCAAQGVAHLVFLSSGGAIYGDVTQAASESYSPAPANFYGVHKWAAERYIELSGIPATILRLANVYGPRQRDDLEGGVVAIFLRRILAGEPVVLYGGEQTRDFLYVSDVVDAITATIHHRLTGIWNVGGGKEITIKELLDHIMAETGRKVPIRVEQRRPSDVSRSCVDASKLISTGHWRPRVSMDEGLRRTIAWHQ